MNTFRMTIRQFLTTVTFGLALCGLYATPARAQSIELVSVDSFATKGNNDSFHPDISADAQFVTFQSSASNLVAGDTNGTWDIFVHDMLSGTTERVSVDSSGAQANNKNEFSVISADGRFVAFKSFASNLVVGDTNGTSDIFVHDRSSGTTERVSVDSSGAQANNTNQNPEISADGRFVAFSSSASNLVADDTNDTPDIFVRDRLLGTTERASVDSSGVQANNSSATPAISGDGRLVAFKSSASNLVAGDTNGTWDIFVHDRSLGKTELVSVDSSGVQTNHTSWNQEISADGRFVAFSSLASNLVVDDTDGHWDIFVHDRLLGTTERVSVNSSGAQANSSSETQAISAEGRFVVFPSSASNLVVGDTNGKWDIFVHDRSSGTTERVSVDPSGAEADNDSFDPVNYAENMAISADGRFVVFRSLASNLSPHDGDSLSDIYVRVAPEDVPRVVKAMPWLKLLLLDD